MAPPGDDQDEMNKRFRPEMVEDALSGRPVTDPLASEVSAVLAELRRLREPAAPDVASRHLAAMHAAFEAAGPQPAPAPRRVRRGAARVSPRWAASSAVVGALTLTGGLAAAGALPAPAQHAVSSVVHHVGVNLPTGDSTSSVPETPTSVPSTDDSAHDESRSSTNRGPGSGSDNSNSGTTGHDGHRGGNDRGSDHTKTSTTQGEHEAPETENEAPDDVSGRDLHRGGADSNVSTTTAPNTTPTTDDVGGGGGGGKGKSEP